MSADFPAEDEVLEAVPHVLADDDVLDIETGHTELHVDVITRIGLMRLLR